MSTSQAGSQGWRNEVDFHAFTYQAIASLPLLRQRGAGSAICVGYTHVSGMPWRAAKQGGKGKKGTKKSY